METSEEEEEEEEGGASRKALYLPDLRSSGVMELREQLRGFPRRRKLLRGVGGGEGCCNERRRDW